MRLHRFTPIATALLAVSAWTQQAPDPVSDDSQNAPRSSWRRFSDASQPADRSQPQGPGQIVIPAGSWIKIRVDQPISSDRNRPGDTFTGTLAQPIVADGYIVAPRGQTIEGRVTDAVKAGRTKGTSRLGFEVTEIGLADGQQMPVRTQLIEYNGGTSVGRDLTAMGVTAGTGAAIGAMAAGGPGAGLGAIAGAVASGIGVLATRGRPVEIYPETVVTFRTLAPITVNTDRAARAFQPVSRADYERNAYASRPPMQTRPAPAYSPVVVSPSFYYGGPYWGVGTGFGYYPYWGGYYAPSFYFGYRGGYYHGGHGGGHHH